MQPEKIIGTSLIDADVGDRQFYNFNFSSVADDSNESEGDCDSGTD